MSSRQTRILFLCGLVVIAAALRLIPHPPSFTPIGALALFGGACFANRRAAFLVPLAGMFVSDLVLGWHHLVPVVYGSFALMVCLGILLRGRRTAIPIACAALAASVMFFVVTNFCVWALGSLYPKTWEGAPRLLRRGDTILPERSPRQPVLRGAIIRRRRRVRAQLSRAARAGCAALSKRVLLSWSSGKDSAWTLHVLRQQPDTQVVGLLTAFGETDGRVAVHEVRRELVAAQSTAAGLPLWDIALPSPCPNDEYERRMAEVLGKARSSGVTHVAFGDLFLSDIREYRVRLLAPTGLDPLFSDTEFGRSHARVGPGDGRAAGWAPC